MAKSVLPSEKIKIIVLSHSSVIGLDLGYEKRGASIGSIGASDNAQSAGGVKFRSGYLSEEINSRAPRAEVAPGFDLIKSRFSLKVFSLNRVFRRRL